MSDAVGAKPPDASQPQKSLRPLILVLGACGFASTFTMRLLDPLVPTLAAEFSRSIVEVAGAATAFAFAYAIGQPFLGPVADSAGKVRTIAFCLAILALLSISAAFATSFEVLTALRAATGVAAGGIIPVAMAALGDRAAMAERQVLLGRFLVLMIVGQVSGAACSGLIAQYFGWRGVFLVAGAITAMALVLVLALLKPRRATDRAPLSLASAIAGYRTVFANRLSKILYLLVMVEGSLVFGIQPYVAAILQARDGSGPALAGFVIAGAGVGGIVYGVLTRVLVERLGPRRMASLGGATMAMGYALFSLPFLPWWSAIGFFMLSGFGFFLMHGTFQAQATELAPGARASAVALFACCLFCGHAIGPVIMGLALHLLETTGALLLLALAIGALGIATPRILPLAGSRT